MRSLAILLQLSDSALPTGGFSHSYGFEQYLSRGEIHDAESFTRWLRVYVGSQLKYTDALLIRMAYDGVDEHELADLALAVTNPAQVRAAAVAVAKRVRRIGVDALGVPDTDLEFAHPALEFARVTRHFDIDAGDAIIAHLTGSVGSITQNAVRGIPIGQSDGQRVIAAAHPWIAEVAADVHSLDPDELGLVAPGFEIAQMQHARLRARMFMS